MAVSLLGYLPELREQIVNAPHLLVLLDFDGTLTPIVDRPCDAHLDAATRETLLALTRRPHTSVAVLSGRGLMDVRSRVGIDGLIYAGNHGLEIKGSNIFFIQTATGDTQAKLQELACSLANQLKRVPGAFVEDKGLTLSVHYRNVAPALLEVVHNVVADAVRADRRLFRLTMGHRVMEIRPNINWNKGMASLWIRNHFGIHDTLPIYLGDDETDEDAFEVLNDGITVKVGNPCDTSAVYFLADPGDVCQFLQWLIENHREEVNVVHTLR